MNILLILISVAEAARLEDAARRTTELWVNVAQASVLGGICLGAVLWTFGAAQVGKTILMGGIFCALAVFGGPALIETIRSLF
ncbi:MAG: hypothetical protein KDD37_10575 [Bdellovibrionales bacterium]|nr:hypothetical protein [Bdellovibrionales bacterium]